MMDFAGFYWKSQRRNRQVVLASKKRKHGWTQTETQNSLAISCSETSGGSSTKPWWDHNNLIWRDACWQFSLSFFRLVMTLSSPPTPKELWESKLIAMKKLGKKSYKSSQSYRPISLLMWARLLRYWWTTPSCASWSNGLSSPHSNSGFVLTVRWWMIPPD